MFETKYDKKPSLTYKVVSYFASKIKRLKIYQSEKDVHLFIEQIKRDGKTPQNFPEDATFKAKSEIVQMCGLKTYVLNPDGKNLMVYLHGGAFINRPTRFHMNFASKIALQTDSRILVPYYPLAPFYNVSQSIEKLVEFVQSVQGSFVLLGDSAGGGLVFALLYALQQKNLDHKVKCVVSVSPWLDMTPENSKNQRDRMLDKGAVTEISTYWEGDLGASHPYCSPCFADFQKPYSALVIVGGMEVLHKDTSLFVEQNRNHDVVYIDYVNLEHDFPLFPVPETKHAISQIVEYVSWFNRKWEDEVK